MTDEVVSKRLIISGLTPAVTPDALRNRLLSFGNVRNLDGFGALDGNGDLRKFGFVTLEAPKAKIQRCTNALSGTSWKGAKLRLGEARPDYRERCVANNRPDGTERTLDGAKMESAAPTTSRPKTMKEKRELRRAKKQKKRLLYKTREAVDMALVTERNAKSKKGWRKTDDGRLIHPLRMRPPHPLPCASPKPTSVPMLLTNATTKSSTDSHVNDAKSPWKRAFTKSKATSLRTRSNSSLRIGRALRTVIDPSRYGASHTRFSTDTIPTDVAKCRQGELHMEEQLRKKKKVGETVVEIEEPPKRNVHTDPAPVVSTSLGSESKPRKANTVVPTTIDVDVEMSSSDSELRQTTTETVRLSTQQLTSQTQKADAVSAQLQQEKSKSIALMRSLLKRGWEVDIDGNSDEDDGEQMKERRKIVRMASVSDDEEGHREEPDTEGGEQMNIETQQPSPQMRVEPTRAGIAGRSDPSHSKSVGETSAEKQDQRKKARTETATPAPGPTAAAPTETAVNSNSLKDLFKPHEDAAFSLLGNLASSGALSNFELEDLVVYEPTQYPSVGTDSVQPPLPVSVPTGAGGVTFDPKAPLFFGVPPFARQEAGRKGARVKDMFDVAKDQGWLEGGGFWRTTTEEEMRRKWDQMRKELTRTYKQRHREAVRLARNVFGRDTSGGDRGED